MKHNDGTIKTVYFDAADTLFYVEGGVGKLYFDVAEKYAPHLKANKIAEAFRKAFASAPPLAFKVRNPARRKALEKDWWRRVVKRVFEEAGMFDEFDAYFDELFEVFRTSAWSLFPETINVLSELKQRGCSLSIISNFDSRIYDVMEHLGILGLFDAFFISSEVGFAKPSPKIFERAMTSLSVTPRQCIHVGDSLRLDYEGAAGAGMPALLIDREFEHKEDDHVRRIHALDEVISYLDGT